MRLRNEKNEREKKLEISKLTPLSIWDWRRLAENVEKSRDWIALRGRKKVETKVEEEGKEKDEELIDRWPLSGE